MRETKTRSVVKSMTWRFIGLVISFVGGRIVGLDNIDSLKLMLITNAAAVAAYYVHERTWNKIDFGRK